MDYLVHESAIIDEKSGKIKPPHMTIKFDDSLKVDSGTLTKFIIPSNICF